MRDRNGVDVDRRGDGEKQGGVEGGESIIRVYYMRGVIFNKSGGKVYCPTLKKVDPLLMGPEAKEFSISLFLLSCEHSICSY